MSFREEHFFKYYKVYDIQKNEIIININSNKYEHKYDI